MGRARTGEAGRALDRQRPRTGEAGRALDRQRPRTGEAGRALDRQRPRTGWIGESRAKWIAKGGGALVDQGLFSGGNFLVNILLARWVSAREYGAFSVAFALYLILLGLYNALILEPLSVLGPAEYKDRLGGYFRIQARFHCAVAVLLGVPMVIIGWSVMHLPRLDALGSSILVMGFASPFMLLLWMVRRFYYVVRNPVGAVKASLVYAGFTVAAIAVLHRLGCLGSLPAFLVLGTMSAVGSALGIAGLASTLRCRDRVREPALRRVLARHWNYSKWVLGAALLGTAGSQIQVLMAGRVMGLESAGAYKALLNMILPMALSISTLSVMFLSPLSSEFRRVEFGEFRRNGRMISAVLVAIAAGYAVLLCLFASPLEHLLYAGKYSGYLRWIPLLSLVPILAAASSGFALMLRAAQRPQVILIINSVTAPVALVSSVLFAGWWSFGGVVGSLVLTYLVGFLMTFFCCRIFIHKKPTEEA